MRRNVRESETGWGVPSLAVGQEPGPGTLEEESMDPNWLLAKEVPGFPRPGFSSWFRDNNAESVRLLCDWARAPLS